MMQTAGQLRMELGAAIKARVYHRGYLDLRYDDLSPEGTHFGTLDAALERGAGKFMDDAILSVTASYDSVQGGWYWDSDMDEQDYESPPFGSREDALEAGRDRIHEICNQALDCGYEYAGDDDVINSVDVTLHHPLRLGDMRRWDVPDVATAMRKLGVAVDRDAASMTELLTAAEWAGYDSIVYTNQFEDTGSESYILWKPDTIELVEVLSIDDAEDLRRDVSLEARLREHPPSHGVAR